MGNNKKLLRVVFSVALVVVAWIMSSLGHAALFSVTAGSLLVIGVWMFLSTVKALARDQMK